MRIDPHLHYCRCGYTFKFKKWQKIVMLIKGEYIVNCPVCHARMRFKLINHVVKIDAVKTIDEGIWRRC